MSRCESLVQSSRLSCIARRRRRRWESGRGRGQGAGGASWEWTSRWPDWRSRSSPGRPSDRRRRPWGPCRPSRAR